MQKHYLGLHFTLYAMSFCPPVLLSVRPSFGAILCTPQLIVSPVRSTYGGYYGLVVVPPPPRPQTLHRSHDNLKNPYRIASIFYMQIDIGERMPGKQDGPGPIIYGPPRPPRIAQNAHFFTLGPIYEKLVIIFFPFYKFVCSVMRSQCSEIFVHLGST